MPLRVVAPTSVNRGRSSRNDRADGPLPITMSSWKSSIAGYSTSSTGRGRRWISSMNRTSPSSRFVRIDARSPARSSAGPLVTRSATPSSAATIPASDVLPSPGGPASSRWSTACPRRLAAPSMISRCSLRRGWPTNSPRRRGRSVVSSATSAGSAAALSSSSRHDRAAPSSLVDCSPAATASSLSASRGVLGAAVVGQLREHARAPRRARSRGRLSASRTSTRGPPAPSSEPDELELTGSSRRALQLDEQPLRGPLPHAGNQRERVEILVGDGAPERVRRVHRQDRQCELRARRRRCRAAPRRCRAPRVSESRRAPARRRDVQVREQERRSRRVRGPGARRAARARGTPRRRPRRAPRPRLALEHRATHGSDHDASSRAERTLDRRAGARGAAVGRARGLRRLVQGRPPQVAQRERERVRRVERAAAARRGDRRRVTIAGTCALSAAPYPVTASFTSFGL